MKKAHLHWGVWLLSSAALAGLLAWELLAGDDKQRFMPGPLSDGHHQLADACDACHTDPLGGGEVLQQACLDCHGEQRVKPMDSHPRAKFKDPRNADALANIDALHCVSCHSEHRPQITLKDGLTQPLDVCFHCHEDVAEERPSHAGMDFMSCKDAGCHNFHDNRALYTNFLIKHLDEPETLSPARLPEREFAGLLSELEDYPHDRYPVQQLSAAAADFPPGHGSDETLQRDWLETAHARAGVNCSACHQPLDDDGQPQAWTDHPNQRVCGQCHGIELKRFAQGRHGMRQAAGLAPMQVAGARLPMRKKAAGKQLTCSSCHGAHRFDVVKAAAEACLGCHGDEHSLAWKRSAHGRLWQREQDGLAPAGTGVSCAGCHFPRIDEDINDWMSRTAVQHNPSAVQSPNSKMIRPACLNCHGLEFSLDALADEDLIRRNFDGKPGVHIQTMDLARQEQNRRQQERANSGGDDTSLFGF